MNRFCIAALLVFGPAILAQSPSADWRTVETTHFRVHYPREYEEWSLHAARRLESIRDEVVREVGFAPPQRIDVIVSNPIADANGIAWPLLDTPRMIFYAEPPGPDEQIGAYGHWIDLLAVHETTHLVHMLRPTRNPLGRAFETFVLPLNPITLRAPRWVLEGYATVIEGRLTGAGRPSSTIRALVLRRWAESGRLPSYGQLSSDQRFLGMSMAYLMGSAYLEWLEQRGGPDSLRNLWSRLTARQRRSFDDAFTGVFGERPDVLYGRFLAELTASAVTIARSGELREGELFQQTPRSSGDPAASPDGTRLAVVIRDRDAPAKLVVWSTAAPEEEERKYEERLARIFARDPEDVRPVRTKPLPRKALHSLVMPDAGDIDTPRWTRDGKAILFAHRVPDAEGFLHFDLYRWDFESLTRITQLAGVRDADPLPDGRTAIAVRSRSGATELVTVDLDVVETHPRVSPGGAHVARVAHRSGRWTLLVDDRPFALSGDASSPEWISEDQLVVTVFTSGFAELHRVRISDGSHEQITRSGGGAFSPAYAKDGRLFFMSLDPGGYVVRVMEASAAAVVTPAFDASLVPAIPPRGGMPVALTVDLALQPGRTYGIGRQEFSWFTGQNFGPDHQAIELGARFGDVIGRLDTIVLGSIARDDAQGGVAVASAWRGWPVTVQAHVYKADDDDGVELRGIWSRVFPMSRLTLEGGALSGDVSFGSAMFTMRQAIGESRLEQSVSLELDDAHYRGIAAVAYRARSLRVAARYQHDGGESVSLGGLTSSILPRSAYSRRILDPALPMAVLTGDDYDGWRIESSVPSMPFTLFYQRHHLDSASLALAGLELRAALDPNPILKTPGVGVTLGVARVLDDPLRGDTKWWIAMRWQP